jgi:hypothetical protein
MQIQQKGIGSTFKPKCVKAIAHGAKTFRNTVRKIESLLVPLA